MASGAPAPAANVPLRAPVGGARLGATANPAATVASASTTSASASASTRRAPLHRPFVPQIGSAQWRGLACFALALGCLWYLDMLTTAWALRHGGVEGGPLARFLVSHDMIPLLVAKTLGLGLIILLAVLQIHRRRERLARWSLSMVGAISLGIVEWNLLGILVLAGVLV